MSISKLFLAALVFTVLRVRCYVASYSFARLLGASGFGTFIPFIHGRNRGEDFIPFPHFGYLHASGRHLDGKRHPME